MIQMQVSISLGKSTMKRKQMEEKEQTSNDILKISFSDFEKTSKKPCGPLTDFKETLHKIKLYINPLTVNSRQFCQCQDLESAYPRNCSLNILFQKI